MNEDSNTAPITGDEIILAANGRPWPTVKDAEKALISSNRDRNVFGTTVYEGGYAIATYRKILEIKERRDADTAKAKNATNLAPIKFYKVKIHPGNSDNEAPTVLLSPNNDAFVVTRGMEVILAEKHMDVLRNASQEDLQPVSRQDQARNPERALKASRSLVYRFPFTVLGMATAEEYDAFVKQMKGSTERALASQELKAEGATA